MDSSCVVINFRTWEYYFKGTWKPLPAPGTVDTMDVFTYEANQLAISFTQS